MTYKTQLQIKATYMRGGTSKGTFFNIAKLPQEAQENIELRNKIWYGRSNFKYFKGYISWEKFSS